MVKYLTDDESSEDEKVVEVVDAKTIEYSILNLLRNNSSSTTFIPKSYKPATSLMETMNPVEDKEMKDDEEVEEEDNKQETVEEESSVEDHENEEESPVEEDIYEIRHRSNSEGIHFCVIMSTSLLVSCGVVTIFVIVSNVLDYLHVLEPCGIL
jgi:hypothetical protein